MLRSEPVILLALTQPAHNFTQQQLPGFFATIK